MFVDSCDVNLVNKTGQTAQDIAFFWDQKNAADTLTDFIRKENPDKQLRNYFSLNNLDRMSEKRKDEEWLKSKLNQNSTKFIVFSDLKPLVISRNDKTTRWKYSLVRLAYKDVETHLDSKHMKIFLGVEGLLDTVSKDSEESRLSTEEEMALFALDVSGEDESKYKSLVPDSDFIASYPASMQLEPSDAGIFAEARSMLDWLDRYKFCATCGSATTVTEGGYKRICDRKECRTNKGM